MMTSVEFPVEPVLMLLRAAVDPSHEAEFNDWYDNQHLPDAVDCPLFLAGARYRSSDDGETEYLAVYALEDEGAVNTPECRAISGFAHLSPYVQYTRRMFRPLSSYRHQTGRKVVLAKQ
jgi:hypothetical protein